MRFSYKQIKIGEKYGRLTVLSFGRHGNKPKVLVRCDCGVEKEVSARCVVSGKTKSCGCLQKEKASKQGKNNSTHGQSKKPGSYGAWASMRGRCLNKDNQRYDSYGGRGITICDQWDNFSTFYKDMGDAPKGKSLGRIDNDGPYSPENCRWETPKQQSRNRRSNVVIVFEGEKMSLIELSEKVGIGYSKLHQRLLHGWTLEEALGYGP